MSVTSAIVLHKAFEAALAKIRDGLESTLSMKSRHPCGLAKEDLRARAIRLPDALWPGS